MLYSAVKASIAACTGGGSVAGPGLSCSAMNASGPIEARRLADASSAPHVRRFNRRTCSGERGAISGAAARLAEVACAVFPAEASGVTPGAAPYSWNDAHMSKPAVAARARRMGTINDGRMPVVNHGSSL